MNPFSDTIERSTKLLQQGDAYQGLAVVDEAIAQAIKENNQTWISTLSHHGANLAAMLSDTERAKSYYQQSLLFNPENPRALYGLAKIADEEGDPKLARQYATRSYQATVTGTDEIMKIGLIDLLFLQWPELKERNSP